MGKDVPLRIWTQKVSVGGESYIIQSAFEMDDFYEALDHFALLLFISIPSLLLCAAAGGYWISTRALAPVDQITQTARTISAQNLSSRLVVPKTGDELQRLSETLNGMLERLEAAFKKITQFTADASHELRTPVAVMRTRAELSLRKARSAEEYRDVIAEVLTELEKTSGLIEQLMFLAQGRFRRRNAALHAHERRGSSPRGLPPGKRPGGGETSRFSRSKFPAIRCGFRETPVRSGASF